MISEVKFKEHSVPMDNLEKRKVSVTNLVSRLNQEKKKERNSNIALSVAAVSIHSKASFGQKITGLRMKTAYVTSLSPLRLTISRVRLK